MNCQLVESFDFIVSVFVVVVDTKCSYSCFVRGTSTVVFNFDDTISNMKDDDQPISDLVALPVPGKGEDFDFSKLKLML